MKGSNKLIAEFMELETPDGVYFEYLTKDGERSKPTHFMLLKYHLSWDWLIPVIEKIQDKHLENPELDYWCVDEIRLAVPNIQQVYYLVVEFIKDQNN
jgi:hypothetical protein